MESHDDAPAEAPTPAEAPKPTGFLHLPYEIRLEIYHLSLPTRTIFDIMEKPTFLGSSYWTDFFTQADDGSDDNISGVSFNGASDDEDVGEVDESDEDSDDDEASADASAEASEDEDDEGEDGEGEDAQNQDALADTWAEETGTDAMRVRGIQGLLVASHQVREEVLDILYRENVFCIDLRLKGHLLGQRLSTAKMERVKHLMLVMHNTPISNAFATDWDTSLGPILSNLKTLRLVVEQPVLCDLGDSGHYEECRLEKQHASWMSSFTSVVDCISNNLPTSAAVLTDVGGCQREQSLSLMLRLSHTKRTVWTKMGDRLFGRQGADDYNGDPNEDFKFLWGCEACESLLELHCGDGDTYDDYDYGNPIDGFWSDSS